MRETAMPETATLDDEPDLLVPDLLPTCADAAKTAALFLDQAKRAVAALVAPAGLPLALACRQLRRLGYVRTTWVAAAVLAPATVAASLVAGLLGPLAIAIYAVILSLPVWIAVAVLRRRQ